MTAHIERYDSREAWLAARATGYRIGSSSVPRIKGCSPYGGPYSVWQEHHAPVPYDGDPPPWLADGLADEPDALALYMRRTGVDAVHTPEMILVNDTVPWAVCSPDALVGTAGGAEIKHFEFPAWDDWAPSGTAWDGEDAFPCRRDVALQTLWHLRVTGRLWWDVVACLPSGRRYPQMRIYRFWRHAPTLARLHDEIAEWREVHLVRGERPPYDSGEQHYDEVQRRFPRRTRKDVITADAEAEALLVEYRDLRARIAVDEDRLGHVKAALVAQIGDGHGLHGKAGKMSWGEPSSRRSISLEKIEKTAPDLHEQLQARGLINISEGVRVCRFTPRKGGT